MAREEPRIAGEEGGPQEDLGDLLQDAAREVADGIGQPVDVAVEEPGREQLDADQEEEGGYGEVDSAHRPAPVEAPARILLLEPGSAAERRGRSAGC
jgi:hypothetical protein